MHDHAHAATPAAAHAAAHASSVDHHAHAKAPAVEAPPLRDRPESRGFWAKGFPLAALGLITLLLIRACVGLGASGSAAPFDAAAATVVANEKAMVALAAITADTPVEAAVAALNLPAINFASGSAEVPADARAVLSAAAAAINLLPATVRFEVAGHTDNTGTPEGNRLLSRKRGQAVADFLVAAGVPRDRLNAQGYGDSRPVAQNNSEEGRFRNRRIEFKASGA